MVAVFALLGGCGGGAGSQGGGETAPPSTPPSTPPVSGCPAWSGTLDLDLAMSNSHVTGVAVLDACTVVIAGYERSTHPGEPDGNSRGFVRRLEVDQQGSLAQEWEFLLDTAGTDAFTGLRVDGERLLVWGTTNSAIDGATSAGDKDVVLGVLALDGQVHKLSQLGNEKPNVPLELVTTADGEHLLVGSDDVYVPTNYVDTWEDPWLASVTEHPGFFALNWLENLDTPSSDRHTAATAYAEGVITAVHGDAGETRGALLQRRQASGGLLWSLTFSTIPYDSISSLHPVPGQNRLLVLGSTYGQLGDTPAGDGDYFLADVDPELGEIRTIRQFGSADLDWSSRLLVTESGTTVVGEVQVASGEWFIELVTLTAEGAVADTSRLGAGEALRIGGAGTFGQGVVVVGSLDSGGHQRGFLRLMGDVAP